MADHERDAGLLEMEPSPVEETPVNSKEGYFPPSVSTSALRPSAVGLSQHSAVWYLSRIEKYSTYIFTAFGIAHITNTSIIPLVTRSVPASESYLLLTRPYYQGIPAEPLLIIVPVCAHVLSGLGLRLCRWRQNAKRYGDSDSSGIQTFFSKRFWPAVSNISICGFPFVSLLFGHAFINRVVPQKFPGGSSNVNLSYVSHAFARYPAVSFAGYTALLAVGSFHMTWGWAKWLRLTPDYVTSPGGERALQKKRRWYMVNGLATAVMALWMAGGFGVIGRGGAAAGWIGRQFDEMYRSIPVVGRWA